MDPNIPAPAADILGVTPYIRGLFLIGLLSAAPAWIITQAGKTAVLRFAPPADTALWTWGVRLLAMVAGGLCGFIMQRDADGVFAGAAGGAASAVIVAAAKGYMKKILLDAAVAPADPEPDMLDEHARREDQLRSEIGLPPDRRSK